MVLTVLVGLLDLNGINTRYETRLNAAGIFTPMEFFQASLEPVPKFRSQPGSDVGVSFK
jgi:hypothetical protein